MEHSSGMTGTLCNSWIPILRGEMKKKKKNQTDSSKNLDNLLYISASNEKSHI